MKTSISIFFFALFSLVAFTACSSQKTAVRSQSTSSAGNTSVAKKGVKWMSFEEAIAANERNPKKIFIDVYTDWCVWCKKMDKSTFRNPRVVKYLNDNFYSVKLDGEYKGEISFKGRTWNFVKDRKSGYHELASMLLDGRLSFPSYVVMNEDQKRIQVIPGYMEAPEFDMIMHYYGDDYYKTMTWSAFEQKYR